MIYLTGILLAITIAIGFRRNRASNGKTLRIAGAILAVSSFSLLILWVKGLNEQNYRFEFTPGDFYSEIPEEESVKEYSLSLLIGEIDSEREKWYFSDLGSINAYRVEDNLEAIADPDKPKQKLIYRKGISRKFGLSSHGVSLNIGWDDAGGEYLTVERKRRSRVYMRTYGSYYGIFPKKGAAFSATRLFITGKISHTSGSVFGLPVGKVGILLVQRKHMGESTELSAKMLFRNLEPLKNPYLNSNNVESFSDARSLLVRGTSFPSLPTGVINLIGEMTPFAITMFFLLALGVFLVWVRNVFPGIMLGIFLALITICSVSKLEFNRNSRPLENHSRAGLYSAISLASSPLWKSSARKILEENGSSLKDREILEHLVQKLK